MTYAHFYAPNGSAIMQLLLRLRERYGDNWTESMADYAINKCSKVPGIRWRVASCDLQYGDGNVRFYLV